MKFRTNKFLKDREKSTERSRKGELKPIINKPIDSQIDAIVETIHKRRHPLFDKAEVCPNKLALGCKISSNRRTKPEC